MREQPTVFSPETRTCANCGCEFTANVWNKIYCGQCGNPIQLARDAYKERNQKMQAECRRRWREKMRAKWEKRA